MTQGFDKFARTYATVLNQSLRVTPGLDQAFFDLVKLNCISRLYGQQHHPSRILDYGCGTGTITALLADAYRDAQVDGYDVSEELLLTARERFAAFRNLRFSNMLEGMGTYDLVLVTNVMHHVEPSEREQELLKIASRMNESARACFFEHNPGNPLARWVVGRCAFDVGAKLVWPSEMRALAGRTGLTVESCIYILHCPFRGRIFRTIERYMGGIPLGAQYLMVITRYPPRERGES